MKKLTQNEINRPLGGDAPNPLFGDPKRMVAKNIIFDELSSAKGAPKGP